MRNRGRGTRATRRHQRRYGNTRTACRITTAKYLDHLPLYRITQIAAREDVTLPLSTLAEWVGRVGVALQPLVDRLILHLLQSRVLHADETPVAQLDPGSGKTQRAYLGRIAATILSRGRASSYSTTKPAVVANMCETSSTAGKATCWSTTMAVTRLYSPKQHHPALN
ncbi:MAG: transposase [Nitrosomonas sp.]|nr:transposase [Nitrosomonas sp.]